MLGVSANPPVDANAQSDLEARAKAERSGQPFLLFRDGDGRQRLLVLAPGMRFASVGRLPSSELLLDWDSQVSREHARLEQADNRWVLVDEGMSSNGTFVNGERLNGRR